MPLINIPFTSEHDIVLPKKRTGTVFTRINYVPMEIQELDTMPKKVISFKVEGSDYNDKKMYDRDIFSHNDMYYEKSDFSLKDIEEAFQNISLQNPTSYENRGVHDNLNMILHTLRLKPIHASVSQPLVMDLPEHRRVITDNYTERKEHVEWCASRIEETFGFLCNGELYVRTYPPEIEMARVVGPNEDYGMGLKFTRFCSDLDGNKVPYQSGDKEHDLNRYPLEFLSMLNHIAKEIDIPFGYTKFSSFRQMMEIELHEMNLSNVENFAIIENKLKALPEPAEDWKLHRCPSDVIESYLQLVYSREKWAENNEDDVAIQHMLGCYENFHRKYMEHIDKNGGVSPFNIDDIPNKIGAVKAIYDKIEKLSQDIISGNAINKLVSLDDEPMKLEHTHYDIKDDNDNAYAPKL